MESNKMDKIRQLNLAKMEQHYADRMIVLVDDLTSLLDQPFPGTELKFYDKDD